MRHQKRGRKLGRDKEHRLSLLRNQVISLLQHGRIKTTLAKAKETRRWAERMIALAKKAEETEDRARKVALRRLARRFLVDRKIVNYLFDRFPQVFNDRNSGFTRIYRLGPRRGDGAEMAVLELVKFPGPPEESKGAKKGAASAAG